MPELIQAGINNQIVQERSEEIFAYLNSEDSEWDTAFVGARRFIKNVYDRYTPNIDPAQRSLGIVLGAAALAVAELRYGEDEMKPKAYGGHVEERVIPTYHHGTHPRDMLEGMFEYATIMNEIRPGYYTDEFFGRAPLIAGFHDLIMGNGRGNDEDQSRQLATKMMRGFGYILLPPEPGEEPVDDGIDATKWDAVNNRQLIVSGQPNMKYRKAAGVGDLITMLKPNGVYKGLCVGVEDNTKKMHQQILTRAADKRGFTLEGKSFDEIVEFYGTSDELKDRFIKNIVGQISVLGSVRLADYRLNKSTQAEAFRELYQQRRKNVDEFKKILKYLQSPEPITPLAAVGMARAHMLGQ